MVKIDFKNFRIPMDISRSRFKIGDARESVANMIYLNVNGIRAHTLAMKIYQSDGETEYSDDELSIINDVSHRYGTPAFIDGLSMIIKSTNNE